MEATKVQHLLKCREAATLLRVSPQTVRAYIKAGRLEAFKISPQMLLVSEASVEELLAGSCVLPPCPEPTAEDVKGKK